MTAKSLHNYTIKVRYFYGIPSSRGVKQIYHFRLYSFMLCYLLLLKVVRIALMK
jgi:hypothetical protein